MVLTVAERKARVAQVFDRVAASYDQGVDYFQPLGRALVEATRIAPGDRVLDVGTGRGACLIPAADEVGPAGEVIGIDLSRGMVDRTNAELHARGTSNARVVVMDAEAPSFEPGTFDAVVAGMSLFFLPDLPTALWRLRGLLRANGRIGFSSFSRDDERWEALHAAMRPYLPDGVELRRHHAPPGHPFHRAETLTRLLLDASFTDVRHVDRPFTARFRDPRTWWDWSWANGQRAILQQIPAERQEEARGAALTALDGLCERDGTLELRVVARFSLARRRGAAG